MKEFFSIGTVQAVLAFAVTGVWAFIVIYAQIKGVEIKVPEVWIAITGLVFGHFFRAVSDAKAIAAKNTGPLPPILPRGR